MLARSNQIKSSFMKQYLRFAFTVTNSAHAH
jgi:hypothetical protein